MISNTSLDHIANVVFALIQVDQVDQATISYLKTIELKMAQNDFV